MPREVTPIQDNTHHKIKILQWVENFSAQLMRNRSQGNTCGGFQRGTECTMKRKIQLHTLFTVVKQREREGKNTNYKRKCSRSVLTPICLPAWLRLLLVVHTLPPSCAVLPAAPLVVAYVCPPQSVVTVWTTFGYRQNNVLCYIIFRTQCHLLLSSTFFLY